MEMAFQFCKLEKRTPSRWMFTVFKVCGTMQVRRCTPNYCCATRADTTEAEIWKILLWSLHWLYMGVWPPVDHNFQPFPEGSSDAKLARQPLADGYCAVLYTIKGDLDFYAKVLKLRHYNADLMCDLCPANRSEGDREHLYNNFSADAKWMKELYTWASGKLCMISRRTQFSKLSA